MAQIKLTQNKVALVDDEDFEILNQHKWCFVKNRYAASRINYKLTYMHRLIMSAPKGMEVDHINNNSLDNRRENLRIVTSHQNHFNTKIFATNRSGYRGVSWDKRIRRWIVTFSVNNKTVHAGTYADKDAAAKAYNEAIVRRRGEFANLNVIGGVS